MNSWGTYWKMGAFALVVGVVTLGAGFAQAENRLVVNADLDGPKIDKNIYGHFSEHLGHCIYEGYWVGEDSPIPNTNGIRNDVVKALKNIQVPVLRWPGGCFADEYHWRDGIGPREHRPTMVNTHWGGVTENNHFGTHEFLELCRQLGADPYINGNMGSGTVEEMADWVEYVNFDGVSPLADERRENGKEEPWRVKYWGVGNENWGCGGQMRPEYYTDLYRRFQTYVRSYPGVRPYKIACGPYGGNVEWMEILMENIGEAQMDGVDLHYYCGSGYASQSATEFEEVDWFHQLKSALAIDGIITRQIAVMDRYDPRRNVDLIVGEWGAWHDREPGSTPGFLYQQNSLRDALVAGINFNIFHAHAERVTMANIAQTVNVLQAMILTDEEKMVLTPTYHVFEMFKVHQDATRIDTRLETEDYEFDISKMDKDTKKAKSKYLDNAELGDLSIPAVTASASRDKKGRVHVSLCNLNPNEDIKLDCDIRGLNVKKVSGRVLTADLITAHNTFDDPNVVQPVEFDDFKKDGNSLAITLPSKSVVVLEIR